MRIEELYTIYLEHPVICTDSRSITKGCIFFALKGDRFNGNAFADAAIEQGAAYVVIDEPEFATQAQCILADDVLTTLQQLANYHRRQLHIPFIAITGSNGKTTTKELIRNVLSKKFRTHATKGNLNNHIGVPLTILSITNECEVAVIEMGANHLEEIKMLAEIAEPGYGLITNIGKAHLDGFGGMEGVKKGKGELYDYLAMHDGIAFINDNHADLAAMAARSGISKKITYGLNETGQCTGTLIASQPYLKISWKYNTNSGEITTQLTGEYNAENMLAAICIGNYFGVDPLQINKAIGEYVPDNSRSQVIRKDTNTIILDAYNANPTSMAAALKNFESLPGKPKIIFLGDMAELGHESSREHARMIELIKQVKADTVILVGKNFHPFIHGLSCHYFETSDAAATWTKSQHFKSATILIKGSRSVKMEKVMEGI